MTAVEVAEKLLSIDRLAEAHNHFVRAAELQRETRLIDSLCTLHKAAYCKVEMKNLQGALSHVSNIMEVIESMVSQDEKCLTHGLYEIRRNVEITRVFVLLLLQSTPMNSEHSKVIEAYTWENDENNRILPEELFLLIQSVVMATQARDGSALIFLQGELYEHLDTVQCDLLHKIVLMFKE